MVLVGKNNPEILVQKRVFTCSEELIIFCQWRPHAFDILALYERQSLEESAGIYSPAEVSGITDKYQGQFSPTRKPPRDYSNFHLPRKYKTKSKQIIVPFFSSPSHDISLNSCLNCCHTLKSDGIRSSALLLSTNNKLADCGFACRQLERSLVHTYLLSYEACSEDK